MNRMRPEYLDPGNPDRSVVADVLVREEPAEEEDEQDNNNEDNDNDDEDEGYSE